MIGTASTIDWQINCCALLGLPISSIADQQYCGNEFVYQCISLHDKNIDLCNQVVKPILLIGTASLCHLSCFGPCRIVCPKCLGNTTVQKTTVHSAQEASLAWNELDGSMRTSWIWELSSYLEAHVHIHTPCRMTCAFWRYAKPWLTGAYK